jgi:hypothetical protein
MKKRGASYAGDWSVAGYFTLIPIAIISLMRKEGRLLNDAHAVQYG